MGTGLELESFYRALWKDQVGFAELRLIDGKGGSQQLFFQWPDEAQQFLAAAQQHSGKTNVYFGVCLRNKKSGKAADVAQAPAVWIDVDFKVTPREKIEEALKTFPVRASLGNMSGGGYHVFWLLKESSTNFEKIVTINRQLVAALGADIKSTDIARILRCPDTLNVKYTPPVECKIAVFRPERVYEFSNFEFLPPLTDPPVAVTTQPSEGGSFLPAPTPAEKLLEEKHEITEALITQLAKHVSRLWVVGHRHGVSLAFSGMLAKLGFKRESVRKYIESICRFMADDEISDRLRCVDDSYKRLTLDPTHVAGASNIEKLIEEFPPEVRWDASRALGVIQRSLKELVRQEERSKPAPFQITEIVKFNQNPPRYEVKIEYEGAEYSTSCDGDELNSFYRFKPCFLKKNNTALPKIKDETWDRLINQARPFVIREVAKEEATPEGQLEAAIQEMLESCAPERASDTALHSVPVKTDDGSYYFKTEVLCKYLRSKGIPMERNEVISTLKTLQYENTPKRLGTKVQRVWHLKVTPSKIESNGHQEKQLL